MVFDVSGLLFSICAETKASVFYDVYDSLSVWSNEWNYFGRPQFHCILDYVFFCYVLFFPSDDGKKAKRKLLTFAMVVVGALVAYLAVMTIARFGDRDYGSDITGTQGGLISYLGQSYINFCVYFDKFEPPFSHFGIIFPFTYQFILGIPSGGVVIQQLMRELTGFETGVFYTFIGHIIVGAGKTVAIIFCMVYTLISLIVTSRLTRHRAVAADQMYLYFALASVMYLGLFGYYYSSSGTTFGLVAVYILLRMMK